MTKSLVIVESPTKARTISKILGDVSVFSSMGHLVDLPKKKLGIDLEKSFAPEYIIIPGRQKILTLLKKELRGKDKVYIATDPDREGEAIGWQIKERLTKTRKEFLRVVFHEITPEAIKEAFAHPRDFDLRMIEAQAARRILDRIVGYFLSPLLWRKISRGLSAGRVQSVALRIIVERERQIQVFVPQEYWEIETELCKSQSANRSSFRAKLEKIEGKKAEVKNKQEADKLIEDIRDKIFIVTDIKKKEKRRFAFPPFITSTLQQEAFNKLKFSSSQTMILAQQLYEGVDIGGDSPIGLITYMRTDSVRIAAQAQKEVRDYILNNFGKDYLPPNPNIYKSKKHTQQAHEAIRPTNVKLNPLSLKEKLNRNQHKLYELIYNRFVASAMKPAQFCLTAVSIEAAKYLFLARGTEIIFDGFMRIYNKNDDQEKQKLLPPLEKGERLSLLQLIPSQHFTKPPARYSEASLIKTLEEEGIGRPSTYTSIIQTLLKRIYTRRIKGYFYPTELGFKVCDLLVEYFPRIMNLKFTAQMEEELDEIEEGVFDRLKVLNDFYSSFESHLAFAQKNIKKELVITDEICEKCGKPMVIRWGRRGKFLSCSGFPQCKYARSITTGVKCPQPDCNGELIERRSRRGAFYGCSNFPRCRYTVRTLPEEEEP
ncbi:MAG: type I DNA topoisomerase [Candidatus Omnitrophica bacterium]|nr:type I DNA topoisomerase [Candidatus Omnitrophota bacterium]